MATDANGPGFFLPAVRTGRDLPADGGRGVRRKAKMVRHGAPSKAGAVLGSWRGVGRRGFMCRPKARRRAERSRRETKRSGGGAVVCADAAKRFNAPRAGCSIV
jgi:hypothetical protein